MDKILQHIHLLSITFSEKNIGHSKKEISMIGVRSRSKYALLCFTANYLALPVKEVCRKKKP